MSVANQFDRDFIHELVGENRNEKFRICAKMNDHDVTIHVAQVQIGSPDTLTLSSYDLIDDGFFVDQIISRLGMPSGSAEVFFWRLLVKPTEQCWQEARNYASNLSQGAIDIGERNLDESFEYGGFHELVIISPYRLL